MDKKRICVLEDDEDIRCIIELVLKMENFEVFSYSTVSDFLQEARLKNAHAYLLDIMLPDGNGLEVCKILREDLSISQVPILMMSANFAENQVRSACCAQDLIKKPFDIEELVERICAQLS
jgi:two-component system phosphate regulon response regulator PhoB